MSYSRQTEYKLRNYRAIGPMLEELRRLLLCNEQPYLDFADLIPAIDEVWRQAVNETCANEVGLDTRALIYRNGVWTHPLVIEMWRLRVFLVLQGERVVCERCALTHDLTAEYSVAYYVSNVFPYSQDCHECREAIVKGWPCQLIPRS